MELKGERVIAADRATTWGALNDPAILRTCIPGCESMEKVADNEFGVVVVAALGPVRTRFQGRILLTDVVEPTSYTIDFSGQGGAAGFAKGLARVSLADEPAGTRLGYAVQAQVSGKLAQVGSRLIDSAALKLADDFFAAFEQQVGGPAPVPGAPPAPTRPIGLPKWIYVVAAVVMVAFAVLLLR